jgi:hypothetical protein
MKTPAEWLKEIKHLSDTEVRHGSSVFLTEEDIEKIQLDAMGEGINDAFYGRAFIKLYDKLNP